MDKKIIYQRLPIFGEIEIHLKNESDKIYEFFEEDLNRLSKLDQLGILHSFLNIPEYKKSDYMLTMTYLIGRAVLYNKNNNFIFENEVKLSGNDKKANFSSAEEFLKSWALLYSIGHLPMTFATEHSFMRFLCKNDNKTKFIKIIKKTLLDSEFDFKKDDDKDLLKYIEFLIENERYMEIYKVFTLLKILNNTNLKNSSYYYPKIKELAKITVLRRIYSKHLNLERKIKLEKIIDYFEIIRKLTFTILDGSISQSHLNLNYFIIFENLDAFMEREDYQTLLDDVNKFYTSDIFNSPESAYYHHRCVLALDKVFADYNVEDLVGKIINNDKELENTIVNVARDVKNEIDGKLKPIMKENTDDKPDEHKSYMQQELNDHIRVYSDFPKNPIKKELHSFNEGKIFGGLLYNPATDIYEIDIYPDSELGDKGKITFNVIEAINQFYESEGSSRLIIVLKNLTKLYNQVIELDLKDKFERELIEDLEKEEDNVLKRIPLFRTDGKMFSLIDAFRDVARYLFFNSTIKDVNFTSWKLGNQRRIDFPIFFRKTELEDLIILLKKVKAEKDLELSKNIEQLKYELEIDEDENKTFYVFSPNTDFLRKTEIDFMLIKFKVDGKQKILRIGEVKPKSRFSEDQCLNQIELIFNIPRSSAIALYKSVMGESTNTGKITVDIGGEKIENMIIFEKSEQM